MNDEIKELEPRDVIGRTEDGLVVYMFNVGRKDQLIKMFTPDEADKVAESLLFASKEARENARMQ